MQSSLISNLRDAVFYLMDHAKPEARELAIQRVMNDFPMTTETIWKDGSVCLIGLPVSDSELEVLRTSGSCDLMKFYNSETFFHIMYSPWDRAANNKGIPKAQSYVKQFVQEWIDEKSASQSSSSDPVAPTSLPPTP